MQSWGCGELSDLPVLSNWLHEAGFDFVQILPLSEMAPDATSSPYSAVSGMAIDPVYISLRDVPDFHAAGGEARLSTTSRARKAEACAASRVDYNAVRSIKMEALRAAFDRFRKTEWLRRTERAADFSEYLDCERWWIRDYALFHALRDRHRNAPWWEWRPTLARRESRALQEAREELSDECLFYSYSQWLAEMQWRAARRAADVGVFGDLPFMVRSDSADAWAHQHAFRFDATVGAPPDAFSETGQDWQLPAYRWDVLAAENDAWIRDRARRNAALYDGYRIDHVVGFYRTFILPAKGRPGFVPADGRDQLEQGERIMRVFLESGARIIAEDLGAVPDFVRASLVRLGIAGFKVFRWERDWRIGGEPFHDPEQYLPLSVAATGTHDTETLVEWWEGLSPEARAAVAKLPFLSSRLVHLNGGRCDATTRDSLLEALVASSSDFLILPVQDVFGWRDRINSPGTVSENNWTWRLPWPVDALTDLPEPRERARTMSRWMRAHNRTPFAALSRPLTEKPMSVPQATS